jgi:hypothetical protein
MSAWMPKVSPGVPVVKFTGYSPASGADVVGLAVGGGIVEARQVGVDNVVDVDDVAVAVRGAFDDEVLLSQDVSEEDADHALPHVGEVLAGPIDVEKAQRGGVDAEGAVNVGVGF